MRTTDSTSSRRLAAVPPNTIYRACVEACGWDIHRLQELEADLDAATHWMSAHATPDARERIAARVAGWQQHWSALNAGEFPPALLVRIVSEARTSSAAGEVAA